MLISSILFLLSSNAVTKRRDKSILYARIAITILICCFILTLNSFYSQFHEKGLSSFGGLYQTTAITHIFHIFFVFFAILASVVNAYYYLAIVKQIFFHKTDYIRNPILEKMNLKANIINKTNNSHLENITINIENIKLSSSLTSTISFLTLIILFFIFIPQEWLNMANILALILFNS